MKLIAATNNPGKLRELKRLLGPEGIEVLSMEQAHICAQVEENAGSYAGNAEKKAVVVGKVSGLPTISDDSGLEVDALDGGPGIYSARYAGPDATNEQRIEKLLRALKDVPPEKRTARFVCTVCCVLPEGKILFETGRCEGFIARSPAEGKKGFGYDPVFIETTTGTAFSELSGQEKDLLSHRGKAVRQLIERLKKEGLTEKPAE